MAARRNQRPSRGRHAEGARLQGAGRAGESADHPAQHVARRQGFSLSRQYGAVRRRLVGLGSGRAVSSLSDDAAPSLSDAPGNRGHLDGRLAARLSSRGVELWVRYLSGRDRRGGGGKSGGVDRGNCAGDFSDGRVRWWQVHKPLDAYLISSPCLLVSLSPCLLVSLSPCLLVSLSPCLLVSLSPCHLPGSVWM